MKTFLLIVSIIFISCSKGDKRSAEESSSGMKTESEAVKTKTKQLKDSSDYNERDYTGSYETKQPASDLGYIQYGISKVPDGIKYSGSVIAMAKWDDRLGSNILIVTETAENSNEDNRSKELFGYHYISDNSGYSQLWKINDFIRECPVDLTLEYIPNSLVITDLDKNGTGESSFLYKMSCKGDVSSDDMKLIMHEGKNKYAIRGTMELVMNGRVLEKGNMKTDPSFDKAPEEFLGFAVKQWNKFKTENAGN